jgi:hypothetical protein
MEHDDDLLPGITIDAEPDIGHTTDQPARRMREAKLGGETYQWDAAEDPFDRTDGDPADDDFDWSRQDLCIVAQPATAVYGNGAGQIVVRQERTDLDGYSDMWIRISPEHLRASTCPRTRRGCNGSNTRPRASPARPLRPKA